MDDFVGRERIIQAKKEVILSAGAIGSPHILLHSGIGDEKELKAVGIKPLVNLPSVGKNFTDHAGFDIRFRASVTDSIDKLSFSSPLSPPSLSYHRWRLTILLFCSLCLIIYSLRRNATFFAQALEEWKRERKGPMTATGTNHILWLRASNKMFGGGYSDPSAGPNTPHLEVVIVVSSKSPPPS